MPDSEPYPTPHLKGQLFVARMQYLRRAHGADSIARVMDALPPEDRERLKGIETEGWYPFATLVRFDKTVARVIDPAPGVYERLGEASSRIRNEWLGPHAALISVHSFLSRAAEEHRRFHTFGHGSYRRTSFNEGEIAFSEYPEVDVTYCLGALGYLRATVELLTSGPVEIEEVRCQCRGEGACVFRIRWTGRAEVAEDVPIA